MEEKLQFETNTTSIGNHNNIQFNLINPSFVINDTTQINGHNYHSISGKSYYDNKNHLNNFINTNETITSKCMPTTPTNLNNLKPNYNKSPTISNDTIIPALQTTSNNSSNKKYNNYLD